MKFSSKNIVTAICNVRTSPNGDRLFEKSVMKGVNPLFVWERLHGQFEGWYRGVLKEMPQHLRSLFLLPTDIQKTQKKIILTFPFIELGSLSGLLHQGDISVKDFLDVVGNTLEMRFRLYGDENGQQVSPPTYVQDTYFSRVFKRLLRVESSGHQALKRLISRSVLRINNTPMCNPIALMKQWDKDSLIKTRLIPPHLSYWHGDGHFGNILVLRNTSRDSTRKYVQKWIDMNPAPFGDPAYCMGKLISSFHANWEGISWSTYHLTQKKSDLDLIFIEDKASLYLEKLNNEFRNVFFGLKGVKSFLKKDPHFLFRTAFAEVTHFLAVIDHLDQLGRIRDAQAVFVRAVIIANELQNFISEGARKWLGFTRKEMFPH